MQTIFFTAYYGDRQVNLLSYQTAVHKSFAVSDNLGEVSAKAQV